MISSILQDWVQQHSSDMKENAMKEVVQNLILDGLSNTDFFQQAAFYGGTALRLFYQLPRFSEDLDFNLLQPNDDFSLSSYFSAIEQEVNSYGLQFEVQGKKKSHSSPIQSAYLRGNEKQHLLLFYPEEKPAVPGNKSLKIKFEIDTKPASGFYSEMKLLSFPRTIEVQLLDKPSLFAGKAGAVVSRNWQTRIKGRDLYDYAFYLESGTPINLNYFWSQLKRYPDYQDIEPTIKNAKKLLNQRFESIDLEKAKDDVVAFIADDKELNKWSIDYFAGLTNDLQVYSYHQHQPRFVSFADSSSVTDVSQGNSPQSKSENRPPKQRKQ